MSGSHEDKTQEAARRIPSMKIGYGSGGGLTEIDDERGGEERVLAGVVHGDGVLATHEDLARVLVHGALRVRHVRHICR